MTLSALDIAIFLVYFGVVVALGFYATRKSVGTKRDYFLAGDKLPWWMIGGSIVASNLSTHQFVGLTGAAYDRGFVAITAEWGAILLGLNVLLWIFLPFYLRNGFYTMPEFLQRRFGGASRVAYAGLILLIYVFIEISAVLYLGAFTLHALLGINMLLSIIALAFFTCVYTIAGGLRAVVWTEMLQLGVLVLGGVALAYAVVHASGGLGSVMATQTEWHLILPVDDVDYPWTQYIGGALCISSFYWATNQFIVQRALAAKDETHARMGVVFAQYIKFCIPFITVIPGLMAAKLFPGLEKADEAFPTLVENLLPHGLIGLVLAGLSAAIMSHVSGAINSCTTIASIDFYLPYINPSATERQVVRFGKIVGVVVGILGVFWAWVLISHSEKPVFIYLMNAYGYFAAGIAAMFLLGIFWRRATHAGALAAGGLTLPLSAALDYFYDMPFANRTGIVFWACIALGIVVSLGTRPKPAEEIEGLIWNWRAATSTQGEHRPRGFMRPFVWWILITAIVLWMYVLYA
ncbi:MAG: sodium/solute symporter [Candidatus Hydrogenedentes bacterium]|nr:sodium/solute symporter [Candidatus Hydrogenedentota bacterium]